MSMTTLTIFQFLKLFITYSFMSFVLPAFVLRGKLNGRKTIEKWMYYFICGNFYMMHIVFLLELLKISNWFTLSLGTIITVVVFEIIFRKNKTLEALKTIYVRYRRIQKRQMGVKSVALNVAKVIKKMFNKTLGLILRFMFNNSLECVLFILMLVGVYWVYGSQKINSYGFTASDIPVHLSWINGMIDNKIFVDGVYPFGFHCVVYYLHVVFGIDVYVILRLMAFVQVIYVHLILLWFLKLCCKNKYLPYAGVFIYSIGDYFKNGTYSRFYASLPQEFGMLFILPAIYFAFKFFEDKSKEETLEKQENAIKRKWNEKYSVYCLSGFAMSFAMTLIVHFYGTMAAGLFCIGIALGFAAYIFRKKYFLNILVTGIISVVIAVFPMVTAYVTGTPLQGSLNWGMSVINGTVDDDTDSVDEEDVDEEDIVNDNNVNDNNVNDTIDEDSELAENELSDEEDDTATTMSATTNKKQNNKSISQKLDKARYIVKDTLKMWILQDTRDWYYLVMPVCIIILFVGGIVCVVAFKEYFYACSLFATAFYVLILTVLQCAGAIGIPELMDGNRCSIYYAYTFPVMLVLSADVICYIIRKLFRLKRMRNVLPFAIVCVVLFDISINGNYKMPLDMPGLETNEAITCLSNIIHEDEDNTWIICSANDETQMVKGHGWHWETSTFLRSIENIEEDTNVTLQAKTIYFFVEKVPLEYAYVPGYDDRGQTISKRGAQMSIPPGGGLGQYCGKNRWIMMSRMYYWAESFRKKYPNDMSIYFENDNFICYKLKQNEYCLFNLAIDYDYNYVVK